MLSTIAWVRLVALGAATIALSGCVSWKVRNVEPKAFVMEAKPERIRIQRADASKVVLTRPAVVGDSIRAEQGTMMLLSRPLGIGIERLAEMRFANGSRPD